MSNVAKDEAELIGLIANVLRECVAEDKCGYAGQAIESLAAIRAAGWAVVPVVPTEEMIRAMTAGMRVSFGRTTKSQNGNGPPCSKQRRGVKP